MNKEEIENPKYRPFDYIIFYAMNRVVHMGMISFAEYDEYYGWKYRINCHGESYIEAVEKDVIRKLN